MLLTGPNMAGKSTWIRQNALIVVMAQIGSYVPARTATIGLCDRVFTRVGGADDISRGQSTFMVEMTETANILNNATDRSLVVLDEVGRGTSTYDGMSLAWAIAEDLHDRIGCRALFATHYHQLMDLAGEGRGIVNSRVAVREWGDEIVFLHRIEQGGTDRSYGLHVARLAGIPKPVLERAQTVSGASSTTKATKCGKRSSRRSPPASSRARRQRELFAPPPEPVVEELQKLDHRRPDARARRWSGCASSNSGCAADPRVSRDRREPHPGAGVLRTDKEPTMTSLTRAALLILSLAAAVPVAACFNAPQRSPTATPANEHGITSIVVTFSPSGDLESDDVRHEHISDPATIDAWVQALYSVPEMPARGVRFIRFRAPISQHRIEMHSGDRLVRIARMRSGNLDVDAHAGWAFYSGEDRPFTALVNAVLPGS